MMMYEAKGTCDKCAQEVKVKASDHGDVMFLLMHEHADQKHCFTGKVRIREIDETREDLRERRVG